MKKDEILIIHGTDYKNMAKRILGRGLVVGEIGVGGCTFSINFHDSL